MTDKYPGPAGEFILYQAEDGHTRVECRFADETLRLSQACIADLFVVSVPTVNEHLKNIYAEGELSESTTIRKFRIVRREGKRAAYLEFAELQARQRKPMTMASWIEKLDDFLRLGELAVLTHAGSVLAEAARDKSAAEYDAWRRQRDALPSRAERDMTQVLENAAKKLPRPKKDRK
jgi:hypothetical protein